MTDPIHVLYVDDELGFAEMAAEFLERENDRLTVDTVTSASEGLDRLADEEVDCIVSDYDMPGRTGIEFLETVRNTDPDLPFILFTGKGSEEVASDAISSGVTDYLQKGTGTDQYAVLANRITNAVASYRSEMQLQQRERELKETTKRMELALQGSESWLWEWNLQTEMITQSAVTGILGLDEDDVTRSVEEFLQEIHPADREEFLAGREAAVEGNGNYHNEFRLRQDDQVRWIESRGQVYPDDSGAPERLIGIATDVTDRKERERELTETTQRLEAIIDASPNAIIVSDTDGVVEQWNPAAERMFGWDAEEVIGEEIPIVPDDKEAEFETHRERMRDGELIDATDTQRLTADGERIDVRVSAASVRDADGQITGAMAIFEDITDRKKRERELEEATERMRLALQGSESWIWEVDLEADTVTQEAVTDLLGVEGDRVTRPVEEFIEDVHPDDQDRIVTNQPSDREGEPYHGEYRLLQNGEVRWIESRGLPYPGEADDPDRIIGIATDITERKKREQKLNTRAKAMETAIDGMAILNDDEEYLYVNEAHADIYGYDNPEAFLGETWRMCYNDEEIARFEEDIIPALSEEGSWRGEATGRYKDGSLFPQELSLTVTDDGGMICVVRDITERKEHEETLEKLHGATRDLMTATTTEEVATRASETATQVLKIPMNGIHHYDAEADALVPVAWTDKTEALLDGSPPALPVDDSLAGQVYRTGDGQNPADVREADETFNPETPFRSEYILPLGDHGVFILSSPEANAFDATDEALAEVFAANVEAALDNVGQRQRLQRERDRLDEFASIISHDLRNPLNVATGRLELAQRECDSDHLDDVAQAHDRIYALIDDVLTLAREGEQVGEREPVDLGDTIDGCWRNVETDEATLVTETEQTIQAEPTRLKQLLENLFRNGVEHGGETVTVTVGDLVDSQGFYVADDGPGIPKDERDAVFEAGYSTAETGTGLGLNIVQEIAEAHGWDITVTDSETGGARFEITGVETTAD